jgi:hypothetical protein
MGAAQRHEARTPIDERPHPHVLSSRVRSSGVLRSVSWAPEPPAQQSFASSQKRPSLEGNAAQSTATEPGPPSEQLAASSAGPA